jgi:hypothetical protein
MARVNPFALYPPSFEEALREVLAVGPSSKTARPKADQKRQPTTRKAKKAKAKKKRKKK